MWHLAALAAAGALAGNMKKQEKKAAAKKINDQKAKMWKYFAFTGQNPGLYANENVGNGDILAGALSGLSFGVANDSQIKGALGMGDGSPAVSQASGQDGSFIPEWNQGTQGPSQMGADYMVPNSPFAQQPNMWQPMQVQAPQPMGPQYY